MASWVCLWPVLSDVGWVQQGRVVDDGDPMLVGVDMAAFRRVDDDPAGGDVEEATAVPGQKRARAR